VDDVYWQHKCRAYVDRSLVSELWDGGVFVKKHLTNTQCLTKTPHIHSPIASAVKSYNDIYMHLRLTNATVQ
jgi:hypothetical protein